MEDLDQFHKSLLKNLHDGICVTNKEKKIVYWNKSFQRITGYQNLELEADCHCHEVLEPIDENGITLCDKDCPLEQTLNNGVIKTVEVYLRHKGGYRVPIKVKLTPFRNEAGKILGVCLILADNSEKINLIDQLNRVKRRVMIDQLTEIGNRAFIKNCLKERIVELKRYDWKFGILFIDIDDFKEINDQYGHKIGDEVLRMVAKTIENNLRISDVVGRWGGDEFIVILADVETDDLDKVALRIKKLVKQSFFKYKTEKIHVNISIGGTIANKSNDIDGIIEKADKRMYESKAKGKNAITVE